MKFKKNYNVCIIGLGYVGLTLSNIMANRGFKVWGVEKNYEILKNLNKPAIIYDFWNHFDSNKLKLPQNVEYISLGNHYKSKYFREKLK